MLRAQPIDPAITRMHMHRTLMYLKVVCDGVEFRYQPRLRQVRSWAVMWEEAETLLKKVMDHGLLFFGLEMAGGSRPLCGVPSWEKRESLLAGWRLLQYACRMRGEAGSAYAKYGPPLGILV